MSQPGPRDIREVMKLVMARPIAFMPIFAQICDDSINAGLMLSQALYWIERATDADGFWKTPGDWQKETRLTKSMQDGARELLRTKGFIVETKKGSPPHIYFRVDQDAMIAAIFQLAENRQIDFQKTAKLNFGKTSKLNLQESCELNFGNSANQSEEKRQDDSRETVKSHKEAETTAETTRSKPAAAAQRAVDIRHKPIENFWREICEANGVPFVWEGRDGSTLAKWLDLNRELSVDQIKSLLLNRKDSEDVALGERAHVFLPHLAKYAEGHLDRYGKVIKRRARL